MMRRTLLGMLGSLVGAPLTGDGLVRPQNAPPAGQLVPGVQPGTTPGVVNAALVIVRGANGGVFVYDSVTGKLIGSISNAATDPVNGTAIRPVIAAYSTVDGSYVELAPGSSGGGAPSVYISSGDVAEQTPARVLSQVSGAGPTRRIVTTMRAPRVNGESAAAAASILLFSESADLTLGAFLSMVVTNDANTATSSYNQSATAFTFNNQPVIATSGTAASPTIVTNEAGWNDLSGFLLNGWTVTAGQRAIYRLMNDNSVWIIADLSPGTVAGGTNVWTTPSAAYTPANVQPVQAWIGASTAVAQPTDGYFTVQAHGQCHNFVALETRVFINARYPLD